MNIRNCAKFILLGICLAVFSSAFCAERELLSLDFTKPDFRELVGESHGSLSFDGNCVTMEAGSQIILGPFPVLPGEMIRVEFDHSCEELTGEDFRVGWCTVGFLDEGRQPVGHVDTAMIRDTEPWRHSNCTITPSSRVRFFTASFGHWGTGGTASYKNIRIFTQDTVADELIGDSDFEDILGVNYWFYKQSGLDWDGIPFWADDAVAEQDESLVVSGKKSLRLSGGGATMVSQEFPYNGEKLIASGWIRTSADFKHGPRASWCGGGVQVVGLDADGKHVAHHDLRLLEDASPWCYNNIEVSFASAVKKVQLFARLFDGAQGTVWIDQLRLRRIPAGAVLPFNGEANTLLVDASSPAKDEINYRVWAGVDALYAHWLLRPDVQQCFPWLHKAGFEMIRFREICNGLAMYPNDNPDGTPNYQYDRFDQLMDMMVAEKFIPNITIGTTPPALSRPGTYSGWFNATAPSDMQKWGAFIEAMFRHSVERYGVEEVNKWYWEIWNEPVLPATHGDYVGSAEDFTDMAMEIYLAAERVEADYPGLRLMTGMTSGGQAGASDEYLFAKLAEMGKLNLIRHRSRHFYAGISGSLAMTAPLIHELQEQGSRYGETHYESGCTEWNATAMQSTIFNLPWNAALAVKTVILYLDNGLDYATFFAMVGHPEMPRPPALFPDSGSMGLLTRTNDYRQGGFGTLKPVPIPTYNAFLMLNFLKNGHRLPVQREAEPVDALAVLMPDGAIRVVLANYDEDIGRQPYTTLTTLRVNTPDGRTRRCTRLLRADEDHGNAHGEWVRMGRPGEDDREAIDRIIEKAIATDETPPETSPWEKGFQVALPMPSPGIAFLEFR